MSRTSRLFDLLGVLQSRRTPATAADLSSQLGVSPRSIYRDIDTLRALGAPIDGQAGIGYRLREGFFLPHFAFSDDELDALILGLGWVRERADPTLRRSSESALAKILSARHDDRAATPEAPTLLAAASSSIVADPPQIATLREAIRRQRKAAISYENLQGGASDRVVWPIAIVHFDDVRVLAAWCERRSAYRHFRVDRLRVDRVMDERYPGRRQVLYRQWREQDRDWRLTSR